MTGDRGVVKPLNHSLNCGSPAGSEVAIKLSRTDRLVGKNSF